MESQNPGHIIEITNEENNILIDLAFQITASPSKSPELFCIQSKDQYRFCLPSYMMPYKNEKKKTFPICSKVLIKEKN